MAGFICRCQGHFCRLHRQPETHECTFDFRAFELEKLTKLNPKVVGSKLTEF
jgi:predicted nucleic acid binding AN1-type Zn finger protein